MIKESIKGHHLDNPEISIEFIYWFFASQFGFTPNQVDDIPYDRMNYMFGLQQEKLKLENKPQK